MDIEYWEGVTVEERERLREHIRQNNINLQISEEVTEPEQEFRGGGLSGSSDMPYTD